MVGQRQMQPRLLRPARTITASLIPWSEVLIGIRCRTTLPFSDGGLVSITRASRDASACNPSDGAMASTASSILAIHPRVRVVGHF